MAIFSFGLVLFLGIHLWAALFRKQREALIQKIGAMGYKGFYSVVSLVGLILIILGWPKADQTIIYVTPAFMRYVTMGLMLIAFILLSTRKGYVAAAVKHPMLAGVKIWAFAHLLSNGDVRSIMLFGGFLAFAVIDRIAVKKRNEPVAAPGPIKNDVIAVVVGLSLYTLIILFLHSYIAGVSLF